MALYRCAACGSPNVVTDTQTGGVSYNYKKGIVGTVVLGVGGAAAGIENKTVQVYKCPDCGMTLLSPMDSETKNVIDVGLTNPDARNNLTLFGIQITWDYLKKKYKNIEEGVADELIRTHNDAVEKRHKSTLEFIADQIISELNALQTELILDEKGLNNYEELQYGWEQYTQTILQQREEALAETLSALEKEMQKKLEQVEEELKNALQNLDEEKRNLIEEKSMLSQKLSTLGFFKFGAKKAMTNRLTEIGELLAGIDSKSVTLGEKREIDTEEIKKSFEDKKISVQKDIEEEYPLPESPLKRKEKIDTLREKISYLKTLQSEYEIRGELSVLTAYYIVWAFCESTNGKGVSFSIGKETDIEDQSFNVNDAPLIFNMIYPTFKDIFELNAEVISDSMSQSIPLGARKLTQSKKILKDELNYYYIAR